MERKKPRKKFNKYKCKSCEMLFNKLSNKLIDKGNKGLICPYCESEFWKKLMV